MKLETYLFFDGDCAAAFDFYKSVFGGDFAMRSTFAEGPPEMGVAEDEKDCIMHVSLPVGDSVLMGSDVSSSHGPVPARGENFAISIAPDSREAADKIFARLSEGGETVMPMADAFWGAYFGMCKDKFGIKWMINFETPRA
ncbi:MAG: VOC family protein [Parvularculaceae bacterium]